MTPRYCQDHTAACASYGIDFGPFPGCRDCGREPAEHEAFGQVYRWPFVDGPAIVHLPEAGEGDAT